MHIESRYTEKFTLPEELISNLPNTITLATTVQFLDSLEGIKQQLKDKQVKLFKGNHAKHEGQILGCSFNKQEETDAFLYIGTGEFHPKALLLKQHTNEPQGSGCRSIASCKPVYAYNPFTKSIKQLTEQDIETIQKQQKGALLRYKTSDSIGIIVSTKPGQNRLKQAQELKQKLKQEDKQAYIFLTDTLDFNELENFPFIECWVNTMCLRIGFDDVKKSEKPLINIMDV